MERLKAIKNQLVSCVESQMGQNLAEVDTKELGEAIDMIKDMEEAMYYCSVVKAMEESKEEKKVMDKIKEYMPQNQSQRYYSDPYYRMDPGYRDMDRDYGRMYYSGGSRGGSNSGNMGMGSNSGGSRNYSDYNYPMEIRDVREGRSPMSRKNYMESKELHKGTPEQMKELEKYMHELSEDITEMIQDATPEEKAMLAQKLTTLASKVK